MARAWKSPRPRRACWTGCRPPACWWTARGSAMSAPSCCATAKPAPPRLASVPRVKKLRRKADARRWVREARGILALAMAGFAMVSLAVFDPAVPRAEQATSVGPIGWWLGWALFRALGYAGFLLP